MTRFPILHIFAYAFGVQLDYFEKKKIQIRNMRSREDQKLTDAQFPRHPFRYMKYFSYKTYEIETYADEKCIEG